MLARSVLALAAAAALATPPAPAEVTHLTILHTNDTHDHLTPFDTPEGKDLAGIPRRTTLIAGIEKQAPNVLVLDAGDAFQGTPLFNFFSGAADYETLDKAGYDATTVGNHDLDNGVANLIKQARGRRFSLLSANLLDAGTHKPIFPPYKIYERGGLKVAVFGVIGDQAYGATNAKQLVGTTLVSPTVMTQPLVDSLRRQADLVVMLSHCGLNEDLALASHVKGIDVIVGGHSHTLVPHPRQVVNGSWRTLVVQAYMWGEYLGKLDLTVEHRRITAYTGNLIHVTSAIAPDPAVAATVAGYEQQIAKAMSEVIGQAPQGLAIHGKHEQDCELGNWVTDLIKARCGAEIGVINQGGLRAPLMPGPITVGAVYELFPFENELVKGTLSGAVLQRIVERAASTKAQAGMLQFSGVTFEVAGGHARQVLVNGQPLEAGRDYRVGTIAYVAEGNNGHVLFREGKGYQPIGADLRAAVLEEIRAHARVVSPPLGRIHLTEPVKFRS